MLKFGNVWQNILTVLILGGFAYMIYKKFTGGDSKFKNLFSKVNLKGGKNFE